MEALAAPLSPTAEAAATWLLDRGCEKPRVWQGPDGWWRGSGMRERKETR
jgi:hypothetical protein